MVLIIKCITFYCVYLCVCTTVVLCWIYNHNGVSISPFYGEGIYMTVHVYVCVYVCVHSCMRACVIHVCMYVCKFGKQSNNCIDLVEKCILNFVLSSTHYFVLHSTHCTSTFITTFYSLVFAS